MAGRHAEVTSCFTTFPAEDAVSDPAVVLLDLDGTLVHSAPGITETINGMLAGLGRPTLPLAAVTAMIGDGAPVLFDRAIAATGPALPADRHAALCRDYVARLAARRHVPEDLYPGVTETLRALADAGHALALVTNKPEAALPLMIADLGLDRLLTVAVGGDGPAGRKPAPGPLLAALARLGADPATAVMVGDSRNDVAAARAAGTGIIVVDYGYTTIPPAELGGDALISRFAALPEALAALNARRRRGG